ncbi:chaplin [Streptomyces sp. NPDC054784]
MKRIAAVTIATGGLVLAGAGSALATDGPSADAQGTAVGSPGVASGNLIQIPIDIPINICGNSVSVVGLLNPAFGNHCANA